MKFWALAYQYQEDVFYDFAEEWYLVLVAWKS